MARRRERVTVLPELAWWRGTISATCEVDGCCARATVRTDDGLWCEAHGPDSEAACCEVCGCPVEAVGRRGAPEVCDN